MSKDNMGKQRDGEGYELSPATEAGIRRLARKVRGEAPSGSEEALLREIHVSGMNTAHVGLLKFITRNIDGGAKIDMPAVSEKSAREFSYACTILLAGGHDIVPVFDGADFRVDIPPVYINGAFHDDLTGVRLHGQVLPEGKYGVSLETSRGVQSVVAEAVLDPNGNTVSLTLPGDERAHTISI